MAYTVCAQVNLTDGLQGHWHLNGHAFDSSGNNINGFLSGGATGTEDRFGRAFGAVGFNGTSALVSIPIDVNRVSGALTLSLWFKTNAGGLQSLVGRHQFGSGSPAEDFMLYLQTGNRGLETVIYPGGSNCSEDRFGVNNHLAASQPICRNRWYFVTWVYDGSRQSIYIDGKLVDSRTVPFATVSECANNLLLGASHQSIPRFFSGAMDDMRLYNRAINPAEVQALYTETNTALYDFSYLPDNCNPLDVRFVYNGLGNSIRWRFDNSIIRAGRVTHFQFPQEGEYPVDLIVEYDNCFVRDTLTKTVALLFDKRNIIVNSDTTVCAGSSFNLAPASQDICWQPHPFLTTNAQGVARIAPLRDTVFVATSVSYGPNKVVNGDFSAGNTAFFTNYNFAASNTTEGQYFVSAFPRNWNGAVAQCTQPNGQQGNMMLVNGDPVPNKIVWQQDVEVEPNATYAFGLDIAALFPVNAAILQFAINGVVVGDSIIANLTPCTWRNFFTIWNAGNATRARISIVNRNIEVQGNDFALDNISFREIRYEVDSLQVRVQSPELDITKDTSICRNNSVQLEVKNAANVVWSPATGLSNANLPNPTAVVTQSITYTATASFGGGCTAQGSVTLTAQELPTGTVSPSSVTLCKQDSVGFTASGGNSYQWEGASFANVSAASTRAFISNAGTLRVTITGVNGCSVTDSIVVVLLPTPEYDLQLSQSSLCQGDTVTVTALGGNRFQWSAGNAPFPIYGPATFRYVPSASGVVGVRINNDACNDSALIEKTITIHPPPALQIEKSGDWDCSSDAVELRATGAETYLWQPGPGISNAAVANPTVRHTATTTYRVRGTSTQGCTAEAAITVLFLNTGNLNSFLLPTAFTPNGDGLNDCFGITQSPGTVTLHVFEIYNRYGQVVFSGTDSRKCWDGVLKGLPQPTGNYMYRLRASTACGDIDQKGSFMLLR